MDEAGPYATVPYAGASWTPAGYPQRYPHAYCPNGTTKILTLFHPATGQVRLQAVRRCTNAVLHAWLKASLLDILQALPQSESSYGLMSNYCRWQSWRDGLEYLTLPPTLPPLRMLLVLDNLAGHKTYDLVRWLWRHGVLPLYTPLGGSWLNMCESIQRLLKRRALNGHTPTTPQHIMHWFEATAAAWNRNPTPFVWCGPRHQRRQHARSRWHALGGSGACTSHPLDRCSLPT